MKDAKYQVLIEEVRGMREEVARIDHDLERDRQDIGNFHVQMEGVQSEVKQMRRELKAISDKNKDSIRDALKPAVKEVKDLKTEISKKKFISLKQTKLFDLIKAQFKRG